MFVNIHVVLKFGLRASLPFQCMIAINIFIDVRIGRLWRFVWRGAALRFVLMTVDTDEVFESHALHHWKATWRLFIPIRRCNCIRLRLSLVLHKVVLAAILINILLLVHLVYF